MKMGSIVTVNILYFFNLFIILSQMLLDDQLMKVQAMNASPFVKAFKEDTVLWEKTLTALQVHTSSTFHTILTKNLWAHGLYRCLGS
jgi:hypothetical protein